MPTTFYKLDIQGIVYLVDPLTATAYTYDTQNPVPIGRVLWADINVLPRIKLYDDWKDILENKAKSDANRGILLKDTTNKDKDKDKDTTHATDS